MSDIGTNYRVEIEVLSPVHIGSGRPDLVDDLDYVRGRQIYVIDVDRMLAELPEERWARAEEATPLSRLLNAREYAQYARYTLTDPTGGRERVPRILEHIMDAHGRPYIPGSSLKGAIRTALAWSMVMGTGVSVNVDDLGRNPRFASGPLEGHMFSDHKGRVDPNRDLLRALHVTDSQPPWEGGLELAQVALHSLRDTSGGRELRSKGDRWSFFVEVLPAGTRLETTLRLDDYLLQPEIAATVGMAGKQDWLRGWLSYGNIFSQTVIAHEAAFYGAHGLPRVKAFYDRLAKRAEGVEAGRECLLQMSWGTGWNSKTVGTALDDAMLQRIRPRYGLGRKGYPIFPKSRRLVLRGDVAEMPMGWVHLRLVEALDEPFVPDVEMAPRPTREEVAEPPKQPAGPPGQIEDLEPEMELEGTVRRIVDYGAFVDIGVGRDGLVYYANIPDASHGQVDRVLSVGQKVHVRVLEVDLDRRRINLTMKGVPERRSHS